ncbi:M48 family metallopeptidase [Sphingobium subterraneum]|uniref:YgjP-like metallopeptidase domain-containing protein n=1 Tax=Sphingobium subterraneum TaxID=627688 RepID=A0A841J6D2_9SPHN|nr:SprT family zinc-dependent metalloprotease [Sphingobium subterraneum]MBB6124098.1 hypothetical protein [Sphingobium subterraneum]
MSTGRSRPLRSQGVALRPETLPSGAFADVIAVDGIEFPVEVRRYAASRGYRLRMDSARHMLRLSIPQRGNVERALAWARDQQDWLRRQCERTDNRVPLVDGARFPVEGHEVALCWLAGAPRAPRLEGGRLIVGGPQESIGRRAVRWLKAHARDVLTRETLALAGQHGLDVTSVAIGDPRSRWGSCTSDGAIRYSWRLILAPVHVRRATVAHEVAHLLHMDHSPDFHAAHARLFGEDPGPAREWLRRHGAALHGITDQT